MSEQSSDSQRPVFADNTASLEIYATSGDQRLSAMFEIAKMLATQHGLEAMLPRFLSCLIDTLEAAETGIFLLYDEPTDRLTIRDARGYDFGILNHIRVAPGEGMSGVAFQTGRTGLYVTPDEISAARANLAPTNKDLFRQATAGLTEPLSAVCVPLTTGRTKVGALVLENRSKPSRFAHADLPFLEAVA